MRARSGVVGALVEKMSYLQISANWRPRGWAQRCAWPARHLRVSHPRSTPTWPWPGLPRSVSRVRLFLLLGQQKQSRDGGRPAPWNLRASGSVATSGAARPRFF